MPYLQHTTSWIYIALFHLCNSGNIFSGSVYGITFGNAITSAFFIIYINLKCFSLSFIAYNVMYNVGYNAYIMSHIMSRIMHV